MSESNIRDVAALCWDAPDATLLCACKIAAFLGVEPTVVPLKALASGSESFARALAESACLIVQAETLAQAADAMSSGVGGLRDLSRLAAHVMVYGFQPTDRHNAVLRAISGDMLDRTEPPSGDAAQYLVSKSHREWCAQFSGLSLGAVDSSRELTFVEASDSKAPDVLIRAGERPFFVRTGGSQSHVFCVACGDIADLDEHVHAGHRLVSWFPRLVPLLMFLRGALGERLWHNDQPRACFIIDDPLLTRRYGFLEYRRLMDVLRRQRCSTSIAFIPWNYRRSNKDVADFISSHSASLSLCVHGCDHTASEFAARDFEPLFVKARLALERMRVHQKLSGVPFDDVMVFPQGRYSAEAVTALKAAGYLAGVNGSVMPTTMREKVVLRDLMEVAVTRVEGFPLFGRHYPRDVADFACDLFLGKPVLVVEHHEYFRGGYDSMTEFVSGLNSLDSRLEWTNLGSICSRACLTRTTANGETEVRFYTGRFFLANNGSNPRTYVLQGPPLGEGSVARVTINGNESQGEQHEAGLTVRVRLDAGDGAEINLVKEHASRDSSPGRTPRIYSASVWLRRHLCEIRDNYVATIPVLRRVATATHNIGTGPFNSAPPPELGRRRV